MLALDVSDTPVQHGEGYLAESAVAAHAVARASSHSRYGAPTNAVITPTGRSVGANTGRPMTAGADGEPVLRRRV